MFLWLQFTNFFMEREEYKNVNLSKLQHVYPPWHCAQVQPAALSKIEICFNLSEGTFNTNFNRYNQPHLVLLPHLCLVPKVDDSAWF